jgi:nucleoid-associated protein YgaU
MNCPVCNTPEIEDDAAACPQCKSDLEIFRLLADAAKEKQTQKRTISVLGIFLALIVIGWASSAMLSDDETANTTGQTEEISPVTATQGETNIPPEQQELIASLTKENETLKAEITSLNAKIKSLSEMPVKNTAPAVSESSTKESGTVTHTVKKGESLWRIAVKYFGDGRKSKKIAKDNGIAIDKILHEGMKLKIQKQ